MFKAIVLICNMMSNQCLEAHDTWGPYKEKAECIARAEQMKTAIEKSQVQWKAVSYKCNNDKGTST